MGINDFVFGSPPTTSVGTVPGFRAPGYGFAGNLSSYLQGLIGTPAPSYSGQIDPGMSPTMQMLGRMTQGYSASPAPQIMGQVAGTLGRYMNPTYGSPIEALHRTLDNPFAGGSPGGRPGVLPGSQPAESLPGVGVPMPMPLPPNGLDKPFPLQGTGGGGPVGTTWPTHLPGLVSSPGGLPAVPPILSAPGMTRETGGPLQAPPMGRHVTFTPPPPMTKPAAQPLPNRPRPKPYAGAPREENPQLEKIRREVGAKPRGRRRGGR